MKVRVDIEFVTGDYMVWVYDRPATETSKEIVILRPNDEGRLEPATEEFNPLSSSPPKPSFRIPGPLAAGVLKSLVEQGSKLGFSSASEDGLRGRVEATDKHLEDMRRLVFDKRPS